VRLRAFALLMACAFPVAAQQPAPEQKPFDKPQGIYATINQTGAESAIRRLGQLIPYERREAIAAAVASASRQPPPVLYALANAVSLDDANMGDAVFWYHVARLRAVYDGLRCKDPSARNAVNILGKGVSPDISRYQRQHRQQTLEIAKLAIAWDQANPHAYDHRWINLYGKVARYSPGTDPAELTVPESEWPEILKRVYEAHLKSVEEFAAVK